MLSNPFMPNAGTPPQTGETRPHLLAIEERLAEDRDGAYRREVTDRLAAARADLRRTIDQGFHRMNSGASSACWRLSTPRRR